MSEFSLLGITNMEKVDREELRGLGLYAPGAYVLWAHPKGSHGEAPFQYPLGRSPVFYIGKANKGATRLMDHHKATNIVAHVLDASGLTLSRESGQYWHPRYVYTAVFGAQVSWFPTRGSETPAALEARLIDDFYWHHGAIPVANSQWPALQDELDEFG